MWPCSWFAKRFKKKRLEMYKRFRDDREITYHTLEHRQELDHEEGTGLVEAVAVGVLANELFKSEDMEPVVPSVRNDDPPSGWQGHGVDPHVSDFSETEGVEIWEPVKQEAAAAEDTSDDWNAINEEIEVAVSEPEPEQGGYDYEEQGGYDDESDTYDSGSDDY